MMLLILPISLALEPDVENYFEDVGCKSIQRFIGQCFRLILKNRSKDLEAYVHQSPFKNLDVLPASPQFGSLAHAL